jgi:predicted nuclease with TOPRIM domain
MNEESFLIDCPMCKARIEVEKKTGKVLRHWEKPVTKEGSDQMKDALEKIKTDKSKLEDYFSKAQGDMEKKKRELLDTFEKEAKRIKDSGDNSKPLNPMDLD